MHELQGKLSKIAHGYHMFSTTHIAETLRQRYTKPDTGVSWNQIVSRNVNSLWTSVFTK